MGRKESNQTNTHLLFHKTDIVTTHQDPYFIISMNHTSNAGLSVDLEKKQD